MITDPIAACKAYAKDNGEAYKVVLNRSVDTYCAYSDRTWEDGVPVTKLFERNNNIPLHIPTGTVLYGVSYIGRASGYQIFEFIYGKAWYRTYCIEDNGEDVIIFDCIAEAI